MNSQRVELARTGAALLIVLGAVILITTVLSTLVATAGRRHATRTESLNAAIAEDLLRQADRLAEAWLAETTSSIVLPPESQSPRISVATHELQLAGTPVTLALTAFDQNGMVPLADAPSSLVSTLPPDVRALRDHLGRGASQAPYGLDQVASLRDQHSERPVFPTGASEDAPRTPLAFGELTGTHAHGSRVAINPNTAPIPLVAAALREAGLGGIEHVIEARSRARPVPLGDLVSLGDTAGERSLEFVSSSQSWAVRVDITVSGHQKSWWTVWQGRGSRWSIVQRLRVTP